MFDEVRNRKKNKKEKRKKKGLSLRTPDKQITMQIKQFHSIFL
jgi:hypothetical protein